MRRSTSRGRRGGACSPPSRYVPRPVRSGRSNDDRASRAGASSRFRPSWRERSPEGTSPSRRRLPGRAEPSGGQSASSYRVSNSFRRLKYISSAISPAASFASRDSSSRAKSDLKATVYSLTTRSKRSRRSLPRWVTWYTIRGRPLGGKIGPVHEAPLKKFRELLVDGGPTNLQFLGEILGMIESLLEQPKDLAARLGGRDVDQLQGFRHSGLRVVSAYFNVLPPCDGRHLLPGRRCREGGG